MAEVEVEHVFQIGTQVEVSSNEQGFKNSWYKCKIIQPPKPNNNSKYSNMQKNSKKRFYWVEYESFVEEDDQSKQLTEHVDASLIRPLPPSLSSACTQRFEKGDFVEANYRYGWWVGTIFQVMDDGLKYLVAFKSFRQKVEFNRDQLRLHLSWFGGNKWTRKKYGSESVGAFQLRPIPVEVTDMERTPPPAKRLKQETRDDAKGKESSISKNDVQAQAAPPLLLQSSRLSSSEANSNCNRDQRFLNSLQNGEEPGKSIAIHESAIEQNPTSNAPREEPGESSAIHESAIEQNPTSNVPDQSRSSPFTKTSKLWKVFESLEVFERIPQAPHFAPLSELNDSAREEDALCMMTKFAFVVLRITEGSPDDLQSIKVIHDSLDYLKEMESHGFDTIQFQDYLKKLLEKREKEEELLEKLEEADNDLKKCQSKVCGLRDQLKSVREQFELEKLRNNLKKEDLTKLEPEDSQDTVS